MLHPSYVELMQAINENADNNGEPVVSSRYSIVIAAAKRARQLIDNADPEITEDHGRKPLSIAVDELMSGAVKILPPDEAELEYDDAQDEQRSAAAALYDSSITSDDDGSDDETESSANGDYDEEEDEDPDSEDSDDNDEDIEDDLESDDEQ